MATRADACVEDAGGEVWPLDAGRITNGNAGSRMTANFLGAVAQYHRDITREKAGEAQERAVSRGVVPYPNAPAGYLIGAAAPRADHGWSSGRAPPNPG